MRSIRDIYDRLERVACVAIAASSNNVGALPYRQDAAGSYTVPPTPTEWAEYIVKHGEALRKTLRWAWAARVEDQ
ncbi:hypothetical protein WMF38_57660 [Sorangium sp. So ce118]